MKRILSFLMMVVLLIGLIPAAYGAGVAEMSVYFIDCGQGDAIFITSGNTTMLVDAGKASNAQKVLNFLDSQGVETLDYVFSSHPDEDHIGGMPAVYEKYQVEHENEILPKGPAFQLVKAFLDLNKMQEERLVE